MIVEKPVLTREEWAILWDSMRGRMKYSLMNDFLSKYSFQNNLYALAGLLSSLLKIDQNTITDIEILNPIKPADAINEKLCVLDINLELNHSEIINIEIQSRFQEFWPERSLTYLCRNFDQLDRGDEYWKIKPCIHIGILEHDLFRTDDPRYTGEFYSEYAVLNRRTGTEYSSKFEIRVLSLEHLEEASPEEKEDPNGLYFWAKLFKARSWEEMKTVAEGNEFMKSFVGTIKQLTAEEEIAQACENRRRYSIEIATYEGMVRRAEAAAEAAKMEAEQAHEEARQSVMQAQEEVHQARQEAEELRAEIERLQKLMAEP